MASLLEPEIHQALHHGLVIPACPLALNSRRQLDERHQRALIRYYLAAGAGGLAVGVHTTQFAIRNPAHALFRPVLELAAGELSRAEEAVRIGGICGQTKQALSEAALLRDVGFHAGLLSLGAMAKANDEGLLNHCRAVAEIIPVIGFYLQPAAGGRLLPYSFWRQFAEIENVVAIKIAPFNRYQTIDVVRAVVEAGREDIALYTGNDDNIVIDLVTPFRFQVNGQIRSRRIVGGLLGQWAVGTRRAVSLHADCRRLSESDAHLPAALLQTNIELTDANAAFFDAANGFAGCIPGIHEVLRRQGLLEGIWCLDPEETLGPGQREEIDRVLQAYPHLLDDSFISENRDQWLSG
jgi:hypothetical protein